MTEPTLKAKRAFTDELRSAARARLAGDESALSIQKHAVDLAYQTLGWKVPDILGAVTRLRLSDFSERKPTDSTGRDGLVWVFEVEDDDRVVYMMFAKDEAGLRVVSAHESEPTDEWSEFTEDSAEPSGGR